RLLHLLQNHSRDFLGRVVAVTDFHGYRVVGAGHYVVGHVFLLLGYLIEVAAHEALDAGNSVRGVSNGLALSRVAYLTLALATVEKSDNRRSRATAFGVGNYNRFVAFHYGNARVGGAQVYTDDFAHNKPRTSPLFLPQWRSKGHYSARAASFMKFSEPRPAFLAAMLRATCAGGHQQRVARLSNACKKDDESVPTMQVSGTLSPANEVPAVTSSSATGTVTGTYTPSTKALNYTVTYSGLTGPATAAHLHFGDAKHTTPAPTVPFTGVPSAASGSFSGTVTLNSMQADSLVAKRIYANIHTTMNGGGELRANLTLK
nr:hypothetical protein [Tanacetum cinerariifolium]